MKSRIFALVGTLAFASAVHAALPAAFTVTVAATDIKQLQFDMTTAVRANWYELWFKANSSSPWVYYSRTPVQRPRFRINTSVHLLDWKQARFFVKACNPGGCTSSNEVGVDGQQLAAMGYFKPTRDLPNQYFGFNFALSADGTAMAVVASERTNGVYGTAGIHVFRKTTPTSGWRREDRFHPNPDLAGGGTSVAGDPIAISKDGKLIAFANWIENSYTGAVYLFRRDAGVWRQAQRITGNGPNDQFGVYVKLDAAGKTLLVGHNMDGGVRREGTLNVYQDLDDGSDQFVHATTVPTPPFDDPQWGWCRALALSEVGHIVRGCFAGANLLWYTQVLEATASAPLQYTETARLIGGSGVDVAIDFLGQRIVVQEMTQVGGNLGVSVYIRNGSGWIKEAALAPFRGVNHSAISGDGKFIAIGSTDDTIAGRGPVFPPYQVGSESGTVAIYERRASGWALRRYVKADTANYLHSFGMDVFLDQHGRVLAVGSPYDASSATNIDGDREDASSPGRGAVWIF